MMLKGLGITIDEFSSHFPPIVTLNRTPHQLLPRPLLPVPRRPSRVCNISSFQP